MNQAAKRKGGQAALERLMPKVPGTRKLTAKPDSRYLAVMTKCINQAGFNWSVIDKKWPQFEEAFFGFDLDKLDFLSPEQWEAYMQDTRVVRNWQKISATRSNVAFVLQVSEEFNGFGRFISGWPPSDFIGLLAYLKKHGARLGGMSGQWFLRFSGKDGFLLTKDVVTAIQSAGVDINDRPSSQRDFKKVQAAFNGWHEETGLSFTHLSKIASYSTGTNMDADLVTDYMKKMTLHH